VADLANWRWAFAVNAVGAMIAFVIAGLALRPQAPAAPSTDRHLFDFRPVFANRRAMGYIIAYAWHCWELFAVSSWVVAFLAASLLLQSEAWGGFWTPTVIGALVSFVALPASVMGNELALRIGRRRTVILLMLLSAILGCAIGFGVALPYPLVAVLCLLYGMTTAADSGTITAGAVGEADPAFRGATLAVHSALGFFGAFLGPLVLGVVLDVAGGAANTVAWGLAFGSAAVTGLIGAYMLPRFAPKQV
jgi:MFS family permease